MVPRTIRKHLARLRRRERGLRLVWGAARWLALALAALAGACLVDYLIDRTMPTPWALRGLLVFLQAALSLSACALLILWPLTRRLSDSRLALMVEDKTPALGHRLISTVQLNQPDARIEGMSPELIGVVTRETEQLAGRVSFPAAADHRRLRWSAAVAGPVLLAAAVPLVAAPALTLALLQRQLLLDVEIPRSVYLTGETASVWPSGEEVVLQFRARGEGLGPDLKGTALAYLDVGGTETYDLVYESAAGPREAIYTARVRPLSVDFRYRAYLADGRTPGDGVIHFEPRPVVVKETAWVVLPEHCGLRPDGTPYEVEQSRGEIVGMHGLRARVQVKVQKPVKQAVLELLGAPYPDLSRPSRETAAQRNAVEALSAVAAMGLLAGPTAASLDTAAGLAASRGEVVLRQLRLVFPKEQPEATWTFDLRPTETAYRIRVLDQHGFANIAAPLRGVTIVPERSPQVALLRERFLPAKAFRSPGGSDVDFEVDGMPLGLDPEGRPGPIRIGYTATGAYGLGQARLRYRVLKKVEGSQEEQPGGDERWQIYPLPEITGRGRKGFDPKRGQFRDAENEEDVPFFAAPSPDPQHLLPRTIGGGQFDFKTSDLSDARGNRIELKPGDQVEFYLEVFNRNPDRSEAVVGRSEARVKVVVAAPEFRRWVFDTLQEENRLRQLEARQRGVFDPR